MSSNIRITVKTLALTLTLTLTLTLAMALGAAMATGAYAAAAPSPAAAAAPSPEVVAALDTAQRPVEELEVLDEIWVRGKLLSEVIEDAEDDFFLLYNKLNRDNQYDVECGMMQLQAGSMIMIRKCVPGFIAYNYGVNTSYGTVISYDNCANRLASYSDGESHFFQTCGLSDTYRGGFVQAPIEAVLMEKGKPYLANVLKVINSNPRLKEKVRGLDGLYKEMELVQGRYVKVKGVTEPVPKTPKTRKPVKASTGPRTL